MEKGTIKSAILDNKWDMKVQKLIEITIQPTSTTVSTAAFTLMIYLYLFT
jgi:hypothetical protein